MSTQDQIQDRITFLENQLASLDHYLPETYQLLMRELDTQQHDLMSIKIQTFYSNQDHDYEQQDQDGDQRNQKQTKIKDHR